MRHLPKSNISHFAHTASSGRSVSMDISSDAGGDINTLSSASRKDLTDTMLKYLKEAAKPILDACSEIAGTFSVRIPRSLKVRVDQDYVHILGGGHTAPNAYPFDPPDNPPVRHPVWGHGPRDKWHWAAQPYRPFLEEGAERGGDKAAVEFSKIIDEWAKEIGKDRP